MANLTLNVGDFDSVKAALVSFLQAQGKFTEYDFEGSNTAALVDLLAYNTYTNLVHNNLAINEAFRSSANIRRNVVARAEEINYVPRSFRSAVATLRVVIRSQNARGAIAIPKGTMFTSRVGNRLFTFTTSENNIAPYTTTDGGSYVFSTDVTVYEGVYATDTYIFSPDRQYDISNEKADTTSLRVSVIEDGGQTVTSYSQATSALDINSESAVFFLSSSPSGKYQLIFGDGVSGKQPKVGSSVVIEYRVSNGRLPNGAKTFKAGQAIDGETDISVTTIFEASSGDVYESINDIKFNASNSLRTQERGAGEQDYAVLLQRDNPDIIDVIATGGEKLTPPQYGKVFLSVASSLYSQLPVSRKRDLTRYLEKRSMMEPVIVDPEFVYLRVNANVSYDANATNLTSRDVQAFAAGQISKFASDNLGKFASTFVRSKFVAAIDNSHASITGNDTTVDVVRIISPSTVSSQGVVSTFNNVLTSFTSSSFLYQGRTCKFEQEDGDIYIRDITTNERLTAFPVGEIDLTTGDFQISSIAVSASPDIRLIGQGHLATITTPPNTILQLNDDDVTVNVQ